ncbi:DUF3455 domain-containing protein [Pseudanabaena sp. PCC 6802]|uniref:DUF3455 domain-containing protein n=1 Tax=Pseudanabaena sp. PCC 6802 TaxID=118173 RepID=UPI000349F44E|nr:DUF3455 domain-containing protein [Pseudanabaena sp. PCC 6802]
MQSNLKVIFASLALVSLSGLNAYSVSANELPSQRQLLAKTAASQVPSQLQVPKDEKLLFKTAAKGVQIYTCQPKEDNPQKYGWKLKAPEAVLLDEKGVEVGKHYGGPTWELKDGSKIQGKIQAKADSSTKNSIPLLLLEVTSHSGKGAMSNVKHVQRLATVGGQAPAKGCDAATKKDAEVKVDYTADYYFYGIAPTSKK